MPQKHSITTEKGKDEFFKNWKSGELNVGKSEKKVPHTPEGQKQAVAIYLSKKEKAAKRKKRQDEGCGCNACELKAKKKRKKLGKYEEGKELSDRLSKDSSIDYSAGVLEALRGDAKRKVKVRDPRVKGGFYYQMREVGDEPRLSAPQRRSPQSSGVSTGVAVGLVGAALIAGAAGGAFAANWQAKDGIRKQIDEVQKEADRRIGQEVAKVQKEASAERDRIVADLSKEADARVETEVEKVRSEMRQQMGNSDAAIASMNEELNRIKKTAKQKIAAKDKELEAQRNSEVQRVREGVKAEVEPIAREFEQRRSALEQEYGARFADLEIKLAENKRNYDDEVRKVQSTIEKEVQSRVTQIENRITQESLAKIEEGRKAALQEADARVAAKLTDDRDKRLAGDEKPKAQVKAGGLVGGPKNGISVGASVRNGLDLSATTEAAMVDRVTRSLDRISAQMESDEYQGLLPEFRQQMQDLRTQRGRTTEKWKKAEGILAIQAARETGVSEAIADAKSQFSQRYQEAIRDFYRKVEGRGSPDPDLIEELDDRLAQLNASMRGAIAKKAKSVRQQQRFSTEFLPVKERFLEDSRSGLRKEIITNKQGERQTVYRRAQDFFVEGRA